MRKGYNEYLFRGSGLSSTKPSKDLIIGLSVHKGLETLLLTGDIDVAVEGGLSEYEAQGAAQMDPFLYVECKALVEGLLRGWHRARYAAFLEEFEVLSVEKEVRALLAPGLTLAARADVVVRRRADQSVFVWNWKTTGNKTDWTPQWEDDIQMWTEALAIEDDLGMPVAGVIVEGLFKGATSKGENTSPFLRGYAREAGGRTLYRVGWEKGWTKFHTWDLPGGLAWWVAFLAPDILDEQFPRSQPILKNNAVVQSWIEEVVQRESDVTHHLSTGSERDKELFFWRNFSKWNCRWCPFKPACKGRTTLEEMVKGGQLAPRVDHHRGADAGDA